MKKVLIPYLVITLVATTLPLRGQNKPEVPKLVESVEVRIINIDVVVTDKKGKPIRGLKPEDFQIRENRVPQKITNFYEVLDTPAAPAPAAAGTTPPAASAAREERPDHLNRKIVFFIDNLSLAPFNRNRVLKAIKTFARQTLRPGDEAMIATWNRSMKVRVPFTKDLVQLEQAFDTISGESALGISNLSERRGVETQIRDARSSQEAVAFARQYSQSVEHDLRQTVEALKALMATLAGVEGKKVLVLSSEGFPMQPGREMFEFIEEMQREKPEWSNSRSSVIEGLSFNSGNLIEAVARAANANGITLYTLHAGGLVGAGEGSAETRTSTPARVHHAAITNSTDSLRLLADLTGGLATVGTNSFDDAFRRIQRDLDAYYSIGYRSGTERVDRQRSVEVKTVNKNYVVRSRRSFVEKSVPTEMTDRVTANLFYPGRSNDLKISVVAKQPVQIESDRFRVPLEIYIPMDNLTLIPRGDAFVGGFTVYIRVANKAGDMSDSNRQTHQLRMTPENFEKMKGKPFTYSVELIMEKGRNRISVGVIDDISNSTGFERQEVLAVDLR